MPASKTAAARAEAADQPTTFSFDGETYTIAPSKDWDLDALDAMEEGQIVKPVKLILGAEQWATFKTKRRTIGDLNAMFEALQTAAGLAGN
ncbi:hypothetical protein GCM10010168_53260 [Actinoplanes ianthinogenes]|uniref:Tail assembly chaperone n=1 Tax=Actinoplanes ianthinogenes TaxID=122358 RepID=A0ABM7LQW7_9ACTN|nr:hypothetical protein [Actinoplanes ianthinogenes]BCJ41676.1 hypothetical protein Aiant_23330 [Actinoplanes ianthinogenes]GGR28481.1 hypothetical protein GCM10010168_53260 [Actinoplanes ianthinogenes]